MNDTEVKGLTDLYAILNELSIGDTTSITIYRQSEDAEYTYEITLASSVDFN